MVRVHRTDGNILVYDDAQAIEHDRGMLLLVTYKQMSEFSHYGAGAPIGPPIRVIVAAFLPGGCVRAEVVTPREEANAG